MFLMDVFIFGGCEKMLVEIIEVLIERGFDITLVLFFKSDENTYLKYVNKKVKVAYLWETEVDSYLMKRIRFWFSIIFPSLVCKRFPQEHYDFVVSFKESYQLTVLASRLKSKRITWIQNILEEDHSINKKGLKMKIANEAYKIVFRRFKNSFSRFDKIICVSEQCKKAFLHVIGDCNNVVVRYNFLDDDEIIKLSQDRISDYEFKSPVLCYIGRLSREKGIIRLINAANRLTGEGYELKLLVIGDGYQFTDCLELISKHDNGKNIFLLGSKDNPYPYIKNSDWCVCSSERESFGLVVLESLLLNTPVISTRCGGPQEILSDGKFGILVDNSDEGIYNGIKEVLDNQGLHLLYKYRCSEGFSRFEKDKLINAICDIFKY